MTTCKGRILLADDEEKNRRLLQDILESQGYQVTLAEDGQQALDKVFTEPPDVVLLDIIMPKMDGYAVCTQLRKDSRTAHLPILIITVLKDHAEMLKGIRAGANDFLTKPIDAEEIRLRVKNAVLAKHLYDEVQETLAKLRELELLRDNLTHMIVHDMRSPLMGITGYLELLEMGAGEKLNSDDLTILGNARSSGLVLVGMVDSLLDISRLEQGKMPLDVTKANMDVLIQDALNSIGSLTKNVSLLYQKQHPPVMLNCDAGLVTRVIANLVGNAIKFTPEGKNVTITVERNGDRTKLYVADAGHGIPREYHEKIFKKFGQVEIRQQNKIYSSGLGLTFCKLAVEAHGGQIGFESDVGTGSTFWFSLPADPQR